VKVCESLDRTYGLRVTPATALDITRRVGDWLRPEYERVLRRIRSAGVVYVDETGAKVDGALHWTWAFTTERETLIAVRKSRGKKVLEEILGEGFDGVIVCDGLRPYGSFTDRLQRCWAHLLREARYLAERVEEAGPLGGAAPAVRRAQLLGRGQASPRGGREAGGGGESVDEKACREGLRVRGGEAVRRQDRERDGLLVHIPHDGWGGAYE